VLVRISFSGNITLLTWFWVEEALQLDWKELLMCVRSLPVDKGSSLLLKLWHPQHSNAPFWKIPTAMPGVLIVRWPRQGIVITM
jgi:hypothetical protein